MLFTDLREVKSLLDIDARDTSEDKNLNFYVEYATRLIEEFVGRPGLTYATRTEYYNGTGSQSLLLNSRPVFTTPAIEVYVDERGGYGQVEDSFPAESRLELGRDFVLEIDQPDGTSRSGILVRRSGFWPKPYVREAGWLSPFLGNGFGVVKVTYTGGYTVDTLPANFRVAANLLLSRFRYVFPLGMELAGESYEDRSISVMAEQRDYLMGLIKPLLFYYRNWVF